MSRLKPILHDHQIRQREEAEQLRGVLGQFLVVDFTMAEQLLDDMKWMLDSRTDLRLGALGGDHLIFQSAVGRRLELSANAQMKGDRKNQIPTEQFYSLVHK
ncbi:hypothetical protein WK57_16640 [Burkholderia ubonensis]|uniref:Uncharacterized protein n=1 Tax=Burkholderia ubonensis TaxID=101571 RepID=A0A106IHU2_9BURK|nr:hypothetical protein WL16_02865 [Burkholderia ubonensis]KWA71473.1 hypothetical protein WL29_06775 [Burkholderia ubonensis]KWZ58728.1 hypothetical protein WK57_16640 [Burkholderia ubonensis]